MAKRGLIRLNSEDITSLMKQIARWYNIDVQIKGEIHNESLSGTIPRSLNLSDVVKLLESYGLQFEFNDGTLIVSDKQK
ncbi:MAG: DUF4974 domain-containing protein [Arachidicoccus sp.]|nr:DUF4974 domain-containing protein [Arachidicoccus sp.]